MKIPYLLSALTLSISIIFTKLPIALALSSEEVSDIADQITVKIESPGNPGSGIIIESKENIYTVLTCYHVVAKSGNYTIITPDGERYTIDSKSIKKLKSGLDLATVQFTSDKSYTIANTGNSDTAKQGVIVYVSGFPAATAAVSQSVERFVEGKITANANKPLADGYALVYSNETLAGMSGGPVLNENGELIGIHGREETTIDRDAKAVTTGNNLGIPINSYLALSGGFTPLPRSSNTVTADDFFLQGVDKYRRGNYKGAIADLTRAIKIKPDAANAYYSRGTAKAKLGDNQGAIADYNKATQLDPNISIANGTEAAPTGVNFGFNTDPTTAENSRLATNSYATPTDNNLGNNNLGNTGIDLGINQSTSTELDSAVPSEINSSSTGEYAAQIAALSQAIQQNPNLALAYFNRGTLRSQSGDKQGALADLQKAVTLAKSQGNSYLAQMAQDEIERLQP